MSQTIYGIIVPSLMYFGRIHFGGLVQAVAFRSLEPISFPV